MNIDKKNDIVFVIVLAAALLAIALIAEKHGPKSWSTVHSGKLEYVSFQPTTMRCKEIHRGIYTIKFKDGYILQGAIRLQNSAWELGEEYDLQTNDCCNSCYQLIRHKREGE